MPQWQGNPAGALTGCTQQQQTPEADACACMGPLLCPRISNCTPAVVNTPRVAHTCVYTSSCRCIPPHQAEHRSRTNEHTTHLSCPSCGSVSVISFATCGHAFESPDAVIMNQNRSCCDFVACPSDFNRFEKLLPDHGRWLPSSALPISAIVGSTSARDSRVLSIVPEGTPGPATLR
jgi:hypothetical protein